MSQATHDEFAVSHDFYTVVVSKLLDASTSWFGYANVG